MPERHGPRSVATPQQCQRDINSPRANVERAGGVTGGTMAVNLDDDAAARLAVAIFAQAAVDALAGDDAAARWLHINEVPPSSWRRVAAVKVTPKLAPRAKPRRGRRVATAKNTRA